MEKLKQITCDPSCGFMVRSHDENEVIELAKVHVTKMHKMKPAIAELKSRIETIN